MIRRLNRSTDKAYSHIRRKIFSGEFSAGHLLSAQDLALEVGVSRTPVRDALRVLEQEGLVELNPRQESRVKSLSYEEFRELCELRIALESYFAALAAERRTEEDLAVLEGSLQKMKQIGARLVDTDADEKRRLIGELAAEDMHFHMTIGGAARNQLLNRELNRLQILSRIITIRHDGKGDLHGELLRINLTEVWEAHMKIFDAIRRGSRTTAKAAMESHLTHGMQMQLEAKRRMDQAVPASWPA